MFSFLEMNNVIRFFSFESIINFTSNFEKVITLVILRKNKLDHFRNFL